MAKLPQWIKGTAPTKTAPQSASVDAFLAEIRKNPAAGGGGRLVFAMDATASREATWELAQKTTAQMFTPATQGLSVQLVFYRGLDECKASRWTSDADQLQAFLSKVVCVGGQTQIARILRHAMTEAKRARLPAMVFIGDCVEEDVDHLCHLAGQLGMLGCKIFLFQEGNNPETARAFAQMARLSGGAVAQFDLKAADYLRQLLGAVAVYAAGGTRALADHAKERGGAALALIHQMENK